MKAWQGTSEYSLELIEWNGKPLMPIFSQSFFFSSEKPHVLLSLKWFAIECSIERPGYGSLKGEKKLSQSTKKSLHFFLSTPEPRQFDILDFQSFVHHWRCRLLGLVERGRRQGITLKRSKRKQTNSFQRVSRVCVSSCATWRSRRLHICSFVYPVDNP